jgi:hypothetical protein
MYFRRKFVRLIYIDVCVCVHAFIKSRCIKYRIQLDVRIISWDFIV